MFPFFDLLWQGISSYRSTKSEDALSIIIIYHPSFLDKFFIYNLVYRLVKKKKDSFWSLLEEEKDVALDASFKVMQYILYITVQRYISL